VRDLAKERAERMETWYRVRYNLPPNDPRFLDLTQADILLEYWTIRTLTRPAGETEFETPDFDQDLADFMADESDFETVTHDGG
jgi:hypothetical protein